jgi:hypothetical protein
MLFDFRTTLIALAVGLGVGAIVSWYAHSKGKQQGTETVQAMWNAERLALATVQAEEAAKARQKEQTMQTLLDQQRKEHQNEVSRLVRDHAALADSLRQRADRPAEGDAGVPQGSSAGVEPATGCTGSQLYRQDGDFLAREAARADQLRLALRACIADRAEIERQLN